MFVVSPIKRNMVPHKYRMKPSRLSILSLKTTSNNKKQCRKYLIILYIGNGAFSDCTGLTSIDLPQATHIGSYAFSGCTSLSSLALTSPDKITLRDTCLELYLDSELTLDKVTLTLHQNKAVGGSSLPLCTSATEWGGKTWK